MLAVLFAVTWVATRLYIFPCAVGCLTLSQNDSIWKQWGDNRCRLVHSTLIAGPAIIQQVPLSYYLFNGLLLLLQLLHIVWSFMIVQSLWIGWKGGMVLIDQLISYWLISFIKKSLISGQ